RERCPMKGEREWMLRHLVDHRPCGAFEDVFQQGLSVAIEATRLRSHSTEPLAIPILVPFRRGTRDDAQTAIAPKLSARSEAVRRDDNGHYLRRTDVADAGGRFEVLHERDFAALGKQPVLGLPVRVHQAVELYVKHFCAYSLRS